MEKRKKIVYKGIERTRSRITLKYINLWSKSIDGDMLVRREKLRKFLRIIFDEKVLEKEKYFCSPL